MHRSYISSYCKNTSEQSKRHPSSQAGWQEVDHLSSQLELNDFQKTNIINTNDSVAPYTEDNQNINLEQTLMREKSNYTSQIKECQQSNIHIMEFPLEHISSNTTPKTQI